MTGKEAGRKTLSDKEAGLFNVRVNVSHEFLMAQMRPMESVRMELFTFRSGHVSGSRKQKERPLKDITNKVGAWPSSARKSSKSIVVGQGVDKTSHRGSGKYGLGSQAGIA